MKYSEFYRLIESYGWEKKTGKNKGTNHAKYVHPDFPYFIPVGRHPSQEVKPGTLNKMLKMAGIKK
jgi:predicted RNA binding protein YcfA (HicA-like mRNA interferase family)